MKRNTRRRRIGLLSLGLIAVAAIVVVLAVFAGTNDTNFTATGYSDVIRFQADGVATLQVRIFDLSGKEVWDSGVVSGDIIDWNRRNDTGERLAYGAYIYSAQGWNASGDLNFQKNGKLALMPGDKVQLQAAPVVLPSPSDTAAPYSASDDKLLAPMGHTPGISTFDQVGIGTTSPTTILDVKANQPEGMFERTNNGAHAGFVFKPAGGLSPSNMLYEMGLFANTNDFRIWGWDGSNNYNRLTITNSGNVGIGTTSPEVIFHVEAAQPEGMFRRTDNSKHAGFVFKPAETLASNNMLYEMGLFGETNDFRIWAWDGSSNYNRLAITNSGNVGIGATSPAAKLEVESSTGQDLIAAYNSTNRVFVVKSTGEVRADGAYYGASFNTGSADVAERINTSEWVEAGNVVEIDSEHAGFFRKSSSPYSTKVAGIISTSPGVILGNKASEEATDKWEDNRPVLAVTGRVPCKVSAENGPIEIGDLLVAFSTAGVAMKGDPERAIGAVIGKAMEPLENGEGTIVVQVMLR